MDPNQILVYVLVASFLLYTFLTRKDAKDSVNSLGEILHQFQEDSLKREEDIWNRANVEISAKHQQLQDAHKMVLKSKGVQVMPMPMQPDLPFQPSGNSRKVRARMDSATMG